MGWQPQDLIKRVVPYGPDPVGGFTWVLQWKGYNRELTERGEYKDDVQEEWKDIELVDETNV